jgi:hypothetical protein
VNSGIAKIRNKSKSYWKHGRRYILDVSLMRNKERRERPKLETIDLSRPDWSKQ